MFYFIVDELDSVMELNAFLKALLDSSGPRAICDTAGRRILDTAGRTLMDTGNRRGQIVAYALGTKPEDMIRGEVRQAYNLA